jgi:hypothetical protein
MIEDSAIRIVLHSAEVVHFTHNIQILIVWASFPHNNICHDEHVAPYLLKKGITHVLSATPWITDSTTM